MIVISGALISLLTEIAAVAAKESLVSVKLLVAWKASAVIGRPRTRRVGKGSQKKTFTFRQRRSRLLKKRGLTMRSSRPRNRLFALTVAPRAAAA